MTHYPYVVTVTKQDFQSLVLDGSFERPVLVDFWADWCAPCRALMPMLAKLAEEYGGRFLLAKVNTEEEQGLAAQFGIRSLPTVQLFKSGRAVDQFMGALSESQVREFLDRHLPRLSDGLLAQAQGLLAAGELDTAQALIEQARHQDPANARLALAEIQLTAARGEIDQALADLDRLPIELANDPKANALRGQLRFASVLADAPSAAELTARLAADPRDSEARYQIAAHQVLRSDYAEALAQLLELMKHDRAFADDAGRKGMLAIFDLLGGQGELVASYRAKMMSALY
jgi:putative thioredoxin